VAIGRGQSAVGNIESGYRKTMRDVVLAARVLRQLRDAGILRELQPGSGRRAATLCFPRLINLAEGREVL
jgi:hypothetical protein